MPDEPKQPDTTRAGGPRVRAGPRVRSKRRVRPERRKGILMLAKIVVFVTIFANSGLLIWYLSGRSISFGGGPSARNLVAEPRTVDFGQVEPGEPPTRSVTIRNRSRAGLDIESIDFTDESFRLKTQPADLHVDGRGELQLDLVSLARVGGVHEGEMWIYVHGDDKDAVVVTLRGETMLPRLALSAKWLNFGEVESAQGARLPLTLGNKGNRPLRIDSIAVRGEGFGLVEPFAPVTLAPRKVMTIEVAFVPAKTGASTGELVIAGNDPHTPERTIRLAGSFGTAAEQARTVRQAVDTLAAAKRDLTTAYTYLTYKSTNKLLTQDRNRMGQELFERAWPNYERANEYLRTVDPSLTDNEFYVDELGQLQRRH